MPSAACVDRESRSRNKGPAAAAAAAADRAPRSRHRRHAPSQAPESDRCHFGCVKFPESSLPSVASLRDPVQRARVSCIARLERNSSLHFVAAIELLLIAFYCLTVCWLAKILSRFGTPLNWFRGGKSINHTIPGEKQHTTSVGSAETYGADVQTEYSLNSSLQSRMKS